MLTALVFIDCEVAKISQSAQEIAAIDGVSEVYSVTGDIDLVAIVKVSHYDHLSDVVADQIGKIPGVIKLRTHLAFRTFSDSDLDAAFALGLD